MKLLIFRMATIGVFLLSIVASLCEGSTKPIPSYKVHSDFLLESWKPNAPILVIFKDPFCPYCLQALKRRDELKAYNAFLFWYPIFGERSENRVREFFKCASPVSEQVISAVINNTSPECKGAEKAHLIDLNRKMFEAYSPDGVPSYYLGERKISLGELKGLQKKNESMSPTVSLSWDRYHLNQVAQNDSQLAKIAVILPIKFNEYDELQALLKHNTRYTWYLFSADSNNSYDSFCRSLNGGCGKSSIVKYRESTEELSLLYGLDFNTLTEPQFILNGRLLSDSETEKYLISQ